MSTSRPSIGFLRTSTSGHAVVELTSSRIDSPPWHVSNRNSDADKEARDELMQRRDWSYKEGYKPRWIIYCTTAIAPMIVEGAEVKPAGARRALQDHVAVIIPNDQWSPSQQGRRRRKRTTGRSSCPAARCSPPKTKRMRSWTSGSRGGRLRGR